VVAAMVVVWVGGGRKKRSMSGREEHCSFIPLGKSSRRPSLSLIKSCYRVFTN